MTCECGHHREEHHDLWGCVADVAAHTSNPRPCQCQTFVEEDLDPPF